MQIYNIILNVIVNNEEAREVKMEKRKGLFQVPSFSDPLGARTQDPNIKSVVLYLLS